MERTDVLELMSRLKLYGMRAAYDEVMATAIKRRHEPPRIVGDLLAAEIAEKQGALDQISADHCQIAAGQRKNIASCSNAIPGAGDRVSMTARSRRSGRIAAGVPIRWNSPAGTARSCVLRSPSTATTAKRSPGLRRLPASPAR